MKIDEIDLAENNISSSGLRFVKEYNGKIQFIVNSGYLILLDPFEFTYSSIKIDTHKVNDFKYIVGYQNNSWFIVKPRTHFMSSYVPARNVILKKYDHNFELSGIKVYENRNAAAGTAYIYNIEGVYLDDNDNFYFDTVNGYTKAQFINDSLVIKKQVARPFYFNRYLGNIIFNKVIKIFENKFLLVNGNGIVLFNTSNDDLLIENFFSDPYANNYFRFQTTLYSTKKNILAISRQSTASVSFKEISIHFYNLDNLSYISAIKSESLIPPTFSSGYNNVPVILDYYDINKFRLLFNNGFHAIIDKSKLSL